MDPKSQTVQGEDCISMASDNKVIEYLRKKQIRADKKNKLYHPIVATIVENQMLSNVVLHVDQYSIAVSIVKRRIGQITKPHALLFFKVFVLSHLQSIQINHCMDSMSAMWLALRLE